MYSADTHWPVPKQRKLVTNDQRAANAESIFSLIALVEVVPVPCGLQPLLVGWILEIGLVVIRWAGKCIWPFLGFDAVEKVEYVISQQISKGNLFKRALQLKSLTGSCVWNHWCGPGTAPQSSAQYCTQCMDSPSVWRLWEITFNILEIFTAVAKTKRVQSKVGRWHFTIQSHSQACNLIHFRFKFDSYSFGLQYIRYRNSQIYQHLNCTKGSFLQQQHNFLMTILATLIDFLKNKHLNYLNNSFNNWYEYVISNIVNIFSKMSLWSSFLWLFWSKCNITWHIIYFIDVFTQLKHWLIDSMRRNIFQ